MCVRGAGRGAYDATAWIHPADRHLLSDPMAGHVAGDRADDAGRRLLLGRAGRRPRAGRPAGARSCAGVRFVVDHTPGPHRGLGDLPLAVPRRRRGLRGHVLRRPALRRVDRPHRPARRRPPDRCCTACATKVLPLADDIVVLPGHGEQTTIGRERATNPFLQDLPTSLLDDRQAHPAERVPRAAARAPRRRAAGDRQPVAQLRACTASPTSRPVRSSRSTGSPRAARSTRRSTSCAGCTPRTSGRLRARPALRPHRAVRALRPRAQRQARVPVPALPDPAGLARRAPQDGRYRQFTQADIDVVGRTSCRSTTTSRSCG